MGERYREFFSCPVKRKVRAYAMKIFWYEKGEILLKRHKDLVTM